MTAPAGVDFSEIDALAGLDDPALDPAPFGVPGTAPDPVAGAPVAEPAPEVAEPAPRKRGRPRKGALGAPGEVDPDLASLWAPETIGRAFTGLFDAVYRLAGAAPLSEPEAKNVGEAFAYWCQKRAPKDFGAWQPEAVLALAILATIPPRMPAIATASAPWWRRAWNRLTGATDTPDGDT